MRRRILALSAATLACAMWATPASGAGPSPGVTQGGDGVRSGDLRYVTFPAAGSTLIRALDADGRVLRHATVAGVWGIPLVAYDGTAEGVLEHGRTLVLAQQIYRPDGQVRKTTTFELVDTRKLRVTRRLRLRGAFSFDAVSPDSRYVYLIEYFAAEDPTLYRVRAYDLRAGKLLAKIVADRRSWATGMQGMPVSRAWRDGWSYTLYGGNARPFVHALNTRGLEAVCINMPWQSSPQRMFDFRLRIDGDGHLVVRGPNGRALAVIDRQTFKILTAVKNP